MATYYVRPTNGSDAAAGTSFATAWQTLQKAADTAVAGDVVRLCAEATETINAAVVFDTNDGTQASPISFIGANGSDGSLDGSIYTIKCGSSFPGSTPMIDGDGGATDFVYFEGVVFDAEADSGGTDALHCVENGSDGVAVAWSFTRCVLKNASSHGVNMRDNEWTFIDCDVFGNGGRGITSNVRNRGERFRVRSCRVHDNGSDGIWCGGSSSANAGPFIDGCEVYDNGGDGIFCEDLCTGTLVEFCTIYGNTGDGIEIEAGCSGSIVRTTTAAGNGGYGFNVGQLSDLQYMDYNHTDNNTSGATSLGGGMPGSNNQTGDPQFASVTDGSEDFTPDNGSPLDGNGIMGLDIGARKAADPAGGGGDPFPSAGLQAIGEGVAA